VSLQQYPASRSSQPAQRRLWRWTKQQFRNVLLSMQEGYRQSSEMAGTTLDAEAGRVAFPVKMKGQKI